MFYKYSICVYKCNCRLVSIVYYTNKVVFKLTNTVSIWIRRGSTCFVWIRIIGYSNTSSRSCFKSSSSIRNIERACPRHSVTYSFGSYFFTCIIKVTIYVPVNPHFTRHIIHVTGSFHFEGICTSKVKVNSPKVSVVCVCYTCS